MFQVESGSGDSGSNAYLSAAAVTTHHADRGNTAWDDFTTPDQEAAIIRASDYIDKRFGIRFVGLRKIKGQGLEWPRLGVEHCHQGGGEPYQRAHRRMVHRIFVIGNARARRG